MLYICTQIYTNNGKAVNFEARKDMNEHVDNARVLVAGGVGFIGSHLCDRLINEGHRVLCIDNLCTGRIDNVQHLLNILQDINGRSTTPLGAEQLSAEETV